MHINNTESNTNQEESSSTIEMEQLKFSKEGIAYSVPLLLLLPFLIIELEKALAEKNKEVKILQEKIASMTLQKFESDKKMQGKN